MNDMAMTLKRQEEKESELQMKYANLKAEKERIQKIMMSLKDGGNDCVK